MPDRSARCRHTRHSRRHDGSSGKKPHLAQNIDGQDGGDPGIIIEVDRRENFGRSILVAGEQFFYA